VRFGDLLRGVKQFARGFFVGQNELARSTQSLKDSVGLNGQLVKRYMLPGQRQGFGEFAAPFRDVLSGACVIRSKE